MIQSEEFTLYGWSIILIQVAILFFRVKISFQEI